MVLMYIVCPGPIDTDMRANSPNPTKRAKSWLDPNIASQLIYWRIKQIFDKL